MFALFTGTDGVHRLNPQLNIVCVFGDPMPIMSGFGCVTVIVEMNGNCLSLLGTQSGVSFIYRIEALN